MNFTKYQHLERFGTQAVEGIENGTTHIFPKIDGTNASIWMDKEICAGSRKRELSLEADNAGFYRWVTENSSRFSKFFEQFPDAILYGEWLVPHSLKTYRDSAWRDFYVFDVMIDDQYVDYEAYKVHLELLNISYIPCIKVMKNATIEDITKMLETNNYLIKDGEGTGEGIVIKNYDFKNKFGNTIWAKVVTSEFKEKHNRTMGSPKVEFADFVEKKICDKYVTSALIDKELAKIELQLEGRGFEGRDIPRLLNTVFHALVTEEMWNIQKEFKKPTISFKKLFQFTVLAIKTNHKQLF